jgi:excisionase family DNA binding protein
MAEDTLLTPEAAAKFLGIRKQTLAVWRCTQRVNLPYVKVGRLVRYRRSTLQDYLERQTVTQTPDD